MPYCVPELSRDGYDLLYRCEPGWGVNDCSWYRKADESNACVHAKKFKTVTRCGCELAKKQAQRKYFDAEAERLGTSYDGIVG